MPRDKDDTPSGAEREPSPKILFARGRDVKRASPAAASTSVPRSPFPDVAAGRGDSVARVVKEKSARKPAVLFGTPKQPAPKGEGPRILTGGEVRRRVPCTAADLRRLDGAASEAVVARALRIVEAVNLDDHHFDDVLRFGSGLQLEHGALAEEELALAADEAVSTAQQLVGRMLELFLELDPDAVFASEGAGLFGALKRLAPGQRPAAAAFDENYPRLLATAEDLRLLAPRLDVVVERLRALAGRYALLDERILSRMLAARFLVDHVRARASKDGDRGTHYGQQADAIETRTASLQATRSTLEVGRLSVAGVAAGVEALAASGRGLIEEDLPAWHTAYAAALVAARSSASEDAGLLAALRNAHGQVMRKLEGKR